MDIDMDMIEFNINDYVYVQLTEAGIAELKKQYEVLEKDFAIFGPFEIPSIDSEGWTKFQLHELMRTFGPLCGPGFNVPFKTVIRVPIS